jgi:hypothetical protein
MVVHRSRETLVYALRCKLGQMLFACSTFGLKTHLRCWVGMSRQLFLTNTGMINYPYATGGFVANPLAVRQ